MSARMESLLDSARLADCARNDVLMGIPPALDEAFCERIDAAMHQDKLVDGYQQRHLARGLELERRMADAREIVR